MSGVNRWIGLLACVLALSATRLPAGEDMIEGTDSNLDREFYNTYLDELTDDHGPGEATLRRNLLASLNRILPREDPNGSGQFLPDLSADELRFQHISRDSAFVRGILTELRNIHFTEYTYIVKAGPYLVLVVYRFNPERFIQAETQSHTLIQSAGN
ncbi:MAG: hypothetical protein KDK27_03890 [Leptospiraceae bacterium]|nr:hypothetical protein [Leptospiraceae bacterium]